MNSRWIGAVLIVCGCGGWGFSLAAAYRRQERMLKDLRRVIQLMQLELQYKLVSLPELCRSAAGDCSGKLKKLFLDLARELDWNTQPDAAGCMREALKRHEDLPPKAKRLLRLLGRSLGRFGLEGQLQGLEAVCAECSAAIESLGKDRDIRLRSYQTLGLCTGAALAILFA